MPQITEIQNRYSNKQKKVEEKNQHKFRIERPNQLFYPNYNNMDTKPSNTKSASDGERFGKYSLFSRLFCIWTFVYGQGHIKNWTFGVSGCKPNSYRSAIDRRPPLGLLLTDHLYLFSQEEKVLKAFCGVDYSPIEDHRNLFYRLKISCFR